MWWNTLLHWPWHLNEPQKETADCAAGMSIPQGGIFWKSDHSMGDVELSAQCFPVPCIPVGQYIPLRWPNACHFWVMPSRLLVLCLLSKKDNCMISPWGILRIKQDNEFKTLTIAGIQKRRKELLRVQPMTRVSIHLWNDELLLLSQPQSNSGDS